MKIIDILNRIANNEDFPKEIECNEKTFVYAENPIPHFESKEDPNIYLDAMTCLNSEIKESGDIEKISGNINEIKENLEDYLIDTILKVNELVEAVNDLKSKGR